MSNIVQKIENEKDIGEILVLLGKVTRKDVSSLKQIIPKLLKNKSWIVRAEILDIIGTYNISGFENEIFSFLDNESEIKDVRIYALFCYYDLNHKKTLNEILPKFLEHPNISLRIAAMCLYYIETEDDETLDKILKIVSRKNCNYLHQASVICVFDYYGDISKNTGIAKLFKRILINTRSEGIKETLKKMVRV